MGYWKEDDFLLGEIVNEVLEELHAQAPAVATLRCPPSASMPIDESLLEALVDDVLDDLATEGLSPAFTTRLDTDAACA